MPPLLRPRLVCHYCGQRSKNKQKDARRFKCEFCDAINFLDENGEIADVPPNETASPRQYARAVAPADSQPFEEVVFCSTCIKNQQLLTEALSNYLPAPEDPAYPQYEASLPVYRRNLEDRYPQVCPKCEPAVRQRILQAGYHAKSDHLRRMMDRSRARQTANRWGWRSLVVRGGGLGYTSSIVGQLCWHAMSALSYGDANTDTVSYRSCLVRCLEQQQPYTACAELFAPVAGLAIVVGLMCIWWNPRWHHKLDGKDGRLTGLHTYYNIQVISLLLRLGSWIWLRDPATSGISQLHQKAAHNLFLVLELILAAFSLFGVVRIDTTPLVNWQASPAPLLSKRQYVPPEQPSAQLFSPPSSQLESSTSQAFPVNNLASSVGPSYDAWRPPTPPEEDPNAMEWEPTSNLQVKPRHIHQKPVTQLSPFYGTLPALPTNRLLHPKPQSLSQPRQAIGVPPGFFDRVSGNVSRTQRNSTETPRLAQPKFFPPSDREADTGLEGIFSSVFSLNTDPTEVREQSTPQPIQHRNKPALAPPHHGGSLWTISTKIIHGISAAISLVGLLAWIFMSYLSVSWPLVRLMITSVTAMIPVADAVLDISRPVSQRRFGEITGFLVEFCALLVFGLNKAYGGLMDVEKCDLAVAGVLSILCWQEFFLCFAHNEDARQNLPSEPDARALPGISLQAERPHQAFSRAAGEPEAKPFMHHSPSQQSQPPDEVSAFSPRFRSNSIESTTTEVSTASTVTTSGWKTPRRKERNPSQSPGFTLGSLALDDRLSSSSSRAIGPTQQHTRRRGAF